MNKNPLSFQLDLNPDDFLPASQEEKESLVIMRESVIVIGKALKLSPPFPPPHTGHATFIAPGVPSN